MKLQMYTKPQAGINMLLYAVPFTVLHEAHGLVAFGRSLTCAGYKLVCRIECLCISIVNELTL